MRTRFVNLRIPAGGNATEPCELIVENGRFVGIAPAGHETAAEGEEWVDLDGALVLPGVIDGHVHFDDPGFTHREDFASGTCAAAAGGVTCVVDMPCTSLPPITNPEALDVKLRAIAAKAHVDYMLWGGVSANALLAPDWQLNLEGLAEAGVAAIKVYTLSGMDTFHHLDRGQLVKTMVVARRLGLPVGVHAEDPDMVFELTRSLQMRRQDSPAAWAESRPAAAEISAVADVIDACRESGARVHVVHLGSGEALGLIEEARRHDLPVSAETCPHFLEFTGADLERLGSILKTAPVVKTETDRERLWRGVADGGISFVTTDHAPGRWPDEKATGSIWTDYSGIPGVELVLPYVYSEGVCRERITLERLVEVTAAEPARFFGIQHRKGGLRTGLDADFVVLDEHASWTVRGEGLHNLNRYTPFEGRRLSGRVRATYVRGRCAYERRADGAELFSAAGTGRFVRRQAG
jgi:allantoinase